MSESPVGWPAREVIEAFRKRWGQLMSPEASGTTKADRAMLRRASSLDALELQPAYHRLLRIMQDGDRSRSPWAPEQLDRCALLVGVAVHVRADAPGRRPGLAMGCPVDGGAPAVSELRFQRLMQSPRLDDLYVGLRRAMPLLGQRDGRANAVDMSALAHDLLTWGPDVRKAWVYDYFGTFPAT